MSVRQGHDIAHGVKNAILEHKPAIHDVLVHIEPADPERQLRITNDELRRGE
jgi:divalent metal cation (Fe/Co/Zn/Cd) transporter